MSVSTDTGRVTLEIVDGPEYAVDDDGWEHNRYKVRLRYRGRSMTTPWMQGLGITNDPTAADVLESLFLDASGVDNARDFEDWASDYGYDTDSRKAEALYKRCKAATDKLAKLMGYGDFDTPPWMTEDAEELAKRYS